MLDVYHVNGEPRSFTFRPKTDQVKRTWYEIHQDQMQSFKSNIIFAGDSIIAGIGRYPDVQKRYFTNISNLGIGGDRAEHLLWRTDNRPISTSACAVVIGCGTNNMNFYNRAKPELIAVTILNIALRYRAVNASSLIDIVGILPRGEDRLWSWRTKAISQLNRLLQDACICNQFRFVKPSAEFILKDCNLNKSLYHTDSLHLNKSGYNVFLKSIYNCLSLLPSACLNQTSPLVSGDDTSHLTA